MALPTLRREREAPWRTDTPNRGRRRGLESGGPERKANQELTCSLTRGLGIRDPGGPLVPFSPSKSYHVL